MNVTLTLTDRQHAQLMAHLFPGDDKEAVAFALCGRRHGKEGQGLLMRAIVLIPYHDCSVRTPECVTWPTSDMPELLARAKKSGMALVKIHSHPTGYQAFSDCDDHSDRDFFSYLGTWLDDGSIHASAIMLPDGEIIGRVMGNNGKFSPISSIKFVGDDLLFWHGRLAPHAVPEYGTRIAQTFGEGTYRLLSRLKIAVVGCSGTGSLVAEMMGRNCVGELVLVDPDRIEEKNLNRIPQATMEDARQGGFKVDVLARSINAMEFGTKVHTISTNLYDPYAIEAVAGCDVVFGCMDSIDGRHLLNRLATFYLLPYFDVGVRLIADGAGGVEQVCGSVQYIKPGGSSLFSRGLYTIDQVHAAALYSVDPETYADHLKNGYIDGVHEEKPAVMSVNMFYAALAVNELLARLHPFRLEPNANYERHTISLSHGIYEHVEHAASCSLFSKHLGRGDVNPLLDMPSLSVRSKELASCSG